MNPPLGSNGREGGGLSWPSLKDFILSEQQQEGRAAVFAAREDQERRSTFPDRALATELLKKFFSTTNIFHNGGNFGVVG